MDFISYGDLLKFRQSIYFHFGKKKYLWCSMKNKWSLNIINFNWTLIRYLRTNQICNTHELLTKNYVENKTIYIYTNSSYSRILPVWISQIELKSHTGLYLIFNISTKNQQKN